MHFTFATDLARARSRKTRKCRKRGVILVIVAQIPGPRSASVAPVGSPVSARAHSGNSSDAHDALSDFGNRGAGGDPHLTDWMSITCGLLLSSMAAMILHDMQIVGNKSLTPNASRLDVVVLAVFLLNGESKSVDTEDVAAKSHELAPGMFSWRKYPDQINLELVRVTLSDAKKAKNGALVTGSGRQGWRLSSFGLSWASAQGQELLTGGIQWDLGSKKAGSVDTKRQQREKKRLQASRAWDNWKRNREVSVQDARELFRIDDYATPRMIEVKVVRLQSLFMDDEDLSEFLKHAGHLVQEGGEY